MLPTVAVLLASLAVGLCAPSTTPTLISTCPSRTVNYITHQLPQQCRKTTWSSFTANATAPIDGTTVTSIQDGTIHTSQAQENNISTTAVSGASTPSSATPIAAETPSPSIASTPTTPEQELDTDSPLDNSKFLSFEDWKLQNLAKAGQSAENIGNKASKPQDTRRRPSNIHNALDSLGDDGEIELDFSGFAAGGPDGSEPTAWGRKVEEGDRAVTTPGGQDQEGSPRSSHARSKDAGKTCKERFNYASFDCAATVLKTNPECSGSSAVLVESKDSYMLNQCRANNKFLILELCEDILVDTVVLANYEFFSSTFRTFRVSVSDRYPVKTDKWKELGVYEARNTREVQAFLVENPLIWARYVRIEFLTHYGTEFYCPLSLVRIHGTTMMEEYKHDGEAARADEDSTEDGIEVDEDEETLTPEAIAEPVLIDEIHFQEQKDAAKLESELESLRVQEEADLATITAEADPLGTSHREAAEMEALQSIFGDEIGMYVPCTAASGICTHTPDPTSQLPKKLNPTETNSSSAISSNAGVSSPASTVSQSSAGSSSAKAKIQSSSTSASQSAKGTKTQISNPAPGLAVPPRETNNTATHDAPKAASSAHSSHHPVPTTQESFFKSVHKRLGQLEANSSLSLMYIEEQSRILRDAFSKVEKRQLSKTTTFLENLNSSVMNELRDFRQQYDQIWQSTVIELENQREQYQRDAVTMAARLTILADEIVFQKRMSVIQNILVLLCVGIVLFSRGGNLQTYLELPIVQSMRHRAHHHASRTPSSTDIRTPDSSPGPDPNSPYTYRDFNNFRPTHRRMPSDEEMPMRYDRAESPEIQYSPPTPTSEAGPILEEDEREMEERRLSSPSPMYDEIQRPMSSPPELPGESEPARSVRDDALGGDEEREWSDEDDEGVSGDEEESSEGEEYSEDEDTQTFDDEEEEVELRHENGQGPGKVLVQDGTVGQAI